MAVEAAKRDPEWWPPELKEWRDSMIERAKPDLGDYSQFLAELAERLVPYDCTTWTADARAAWTALPPGAPVAAVAFIIASATDHARGPHESRAAKRDRYKRAAQAAREFAEAIRATGLDRAPRSDLPRDAIEELLLCEVHHDHPVTKRAYPPGDRSLDRFFVEWLPPGIRPYNAISRFALLLAEKADDIADQAMTEKRMVAHLKRDSVARTYFIRELARNFHFMFGEYLQATIARFASVALDEDVDETAVNSALRGFKPKGFDPYP